MRPKIFFLFIFICALFLANFSQLSAQSASTEAGIEDIMKEYNAVGLSVAVVKKGKIIYTHSFGYKDLESKTPLSDNDIFRIASISKSFSATSIMQLVQAGKLSLDDDISNLVGFKVRNPKYPDNVITLRMVMSHRSSINDSQGYFSFDGINPNLNPDWAKCYNNYAPDSGYQYCNLNYNMVGAVIEKFSGERFDQYVKKHILDPLGLYGGYCVDSLDKSRFATLYEYDDSLKKFDAAPNAYNPRSDEVRNYITGVSTPIFSPTGGMKISAPDLARYMIMHMQQGKANGKKIISKKSAGILQTPRGKEGYGLALTKTQKLIAGKEMTGHTGSAYGLYSMMFFHPKEKFGFVVITNGCVPKYTEGFTALNYKVLNYLYQQFIK